MAPALAIVVPTVGRSDVLLPLLAQLVAGARDTDEIVVVDQSTGVGRARTAQWVEGTVVRLIHRLPPGLPAARNTGVAATTAPIVLFLDDDVVLADGCLDAHRRAYADPTVGGATGRIRERNLRPNSRVTTNRIDRGGRIRTNLDGPDPVFVDTLKGANMSFRRQALDEVGPFDEGYGGTALLEDADLSTRVRRKGWRLRYVPEAEVAHLHLATGGVRMDPAGGSEWWRFHNTGRFVRRHHRLVDTPLVAVTFAAIAARRAVEARDPRVAPRLVRALVTGWRGVLR